MANNGFVKLAYAMVEDAGYDTSKMSWTEVLEKFKTLENKDNDNEDSTDEISSEYKQEITKLIDTLKSIKKIKQKELINYIKNLKPINLRTNNKEIIAEFDIHSARENVYGDKVSDKDGYNYKISNIEKLPKYIEESQYSNSSNEAGKKINHIKVLRSGIILLMKLKQKKEILILL